MSATTAVDPVERSKFIWLFLHSFCTQIFIAVYFSVANAQLVQFFDSQQLPLAYLASGFVGFAMASQYKRLLSRFSRKYVFAGILWLVGGLGLILTLIAWRAQSMYPTGDSPFVVWSAFAVFIFASPFIALIGLETGGLTLSLLDLRQTKRLQGRISIGATLASILGCFVMAALVPRVIDNSLIMVFFSLVGIVGARFTLGVLVRKYELHAPPETKPSSTVNKPRGKFYKKKYYVLMASVASVSTVLFYMADFLYLSSIPQQEWLQDPGKKSQFIAAAFGVIKTGELILSYLSGPILGRFGLRVGLMILPIGLLLWMTAATVVGFLPNSEDQALVFFGLVLATKFTERTARKSIDDPAFKTLYQPLPGAKRLAVQGLIEGIFKQWAIVLAGVLLLVLGQIIPTLDGEHIQPQYIALISIPLLVIVIFLTIRLQVQYRSKLASFLRYGMGWRMVQESIFGLDLVKYHTQSKAKSDYQHISLRILEAMEPGGAAKELNSLLQGNVDTQKLALQLLDHSYESSPQMKKRLEWLVEISEDSEVKALTQSALDRMHSAEKAASEHGAILRLSLPEKESMLRRWFFEGHVPKPEVMLRLLKDTDRRVRCGAIRMVAKEPDPVYKYPLLALLENPEFSTLAVTAVSKYGPDIIPDLESLFYRKEDHQLKLKILRIYRYMEHPDASALLFEYLNYPDREVQMTALRSLSYLQYRVKGAQLQQVRKRIEDRVEHLVWLSAKEENIHGEPGCERLEEGLRQEVMVNREIILMLLGLYYGHSKLALVTRSLRDKDQVQSRVFALELIDNLLEDEDKQRVMPLFDSRRPVHQVAHFRRKYPQAVRNFEDNLRDIIIHTQANTGLWIKAHAIQLLGKRVDTLPHEIAACLYHPHPLIHQTAAEVIHRDFLLEWPRMVSKLPKSIAKLLSQLVDSKNHVDDLIYNKVEYMMQVPLFRGIPHFRLLDLAQALIVRRFAPGEELHFSRIKDREIVCIVMEGALEAYRDDQAYFWFSKNQVFIQDILPEESTVKLASRRGCTVLTMDREHFFDLAVHQAPLMEALLDSLFAASQKEFEFENLVSLLRKR